MQLPTSMMLVAALVFAAAAAAVTPVNAEPVLSDVAYMQAAHCAGLAQGAKLDTTKVDALLKSQAWGRMAIATDRADEMREEARRQASRAGPFESQALAAERNGACSPYLGTAPETAQLPGASGG